MTRKGAILAGALALAVVGAVSVAFARGHPGESDQIQKMVSPHGAYSIETDTCGLCHSTHDSKDPALSGFRTERRMCLQCHSGQEGAPNVLAEYRNGSGGISEDSMGHRVTPDGEGLDCTDCHTPHRDPAENPGLLRTQVLNERGNKTFLYNEVGRPVGNIFCYSCHGPAEEIAGDPIPRPFGDFTAFEDSAHNQLWKLDEAVDPDHEKPPGDPDLRTPKLREAERADNTTGKIACLYCHASHDSDNGGITVEDQELLCFRCHSKADPNTAEGTSVFRAFKTSDNVYGDGESPVRIFHHPIAADEQQDGARQVECVSCHNPHFDDATSRGEDSQVANPRRTRAAWQVKWKRRAPAARTDGDINAFCTVCHVAPDVTAPVNVSDTVPYNVRLVNDTSLDPGGQPHDLFEAAQFKQSTHASTACTACHDMHGSSNAYSLREIVVSPDGSRERAMFDFRGMDQPDDRQRYASFCLTCHRATAGPHVDRMLESGSYCRECHYHGSEEF